MKKIALILNISIAILFFSCKQQDKQDTTNETVIVKERHEPKKEPIISKAPKNFCQKTVMMLRN